MLKFPVFETGFVESIKCLVFLLNVRLDFCFHLTHFYVPDDHAAILLKDQGYINAAYIEVRICFFYNLEITLIKLYYREISKLQSYLEKK